jgi:predicted enzyme related to lactoylglutathione lyase
MDWTLEVIVIPVTDVDRAKQFYSEQLRFTDPDGNNWAVQEVPAARPPLE